MPNLCPTDTDTTDHSITESLVPRLLLDLVSAPAAYAKLKPETLDERQRAAIAWLASLGGSVEPGLMAQRLAESYGLVERGECTEPRSAKGNSSEIAVVLYWRLAQRPPRDAQALIAESLSSAEVASNDQTPEHTDALVTATANMHARWAEFSNDPTDAAKLLTVLQAQLEAFQASLVLVHGEQMVVAAEAVEVAEAASRGDAEAVISVLGEWLGARALLPDSVLSAARLALRFSRARTIGEAERALLIEVLGLGPWAQGLIFGASAGVPVLEGEDNQNLVGEGTLGYDAGPWGAAVFGGGSFYHFQTEEQDSTLTFRWEISADGWYSVDLTERTQLDFRGSFNHTYFDSDQTLQSAAFYTEEDSWIVRGLALVGIRHQHPHLALGLWLGGGLQVENADNFAFVNPEVIINESITTGGEGEARARVQWTFVPRVLALRAAVNWKYYTLTRLLTDTVGAGTADVALVEYDNRSIQIEAIGRFFLDLEVARVFDFVPGVGVGIDHYQLAVEGSETQVATVPVYSVGIRKTVF
jgi:hypothetical protein